MPSLIDLRRRIRSVKNTQQITKAMKMVSAAKLRRAQQAVLASRPYSTALRGMIESILTQADNDDPVRRHPLLAQREEKRIQLIVLAGDKGLCGAFNSHVFRAGQDFREKHASESLEFELLGRKSRDFFRRRNVKVTGEWLNIFKAVDRAVAEEISAKVIGRFEAAEIDSAYLIYNEFKSVMTRHVVVQPLLPIQAASTDTKPGVGYIYEQPPESIFDSLLPRYITTQIFQAMLESAAAEHASRMTAMDSATRNAGEVIEKLTLHLNRVRQASITTELIEVISGASVLE